MRQRLTFLQQSSVKAAQTQGGEGEAQGRGDRNDELKKGGSCEHVRSIVSSGKEDGGETGGKNRGELDLTLWNARKKTSFDRRECRSEFGKPLFQEKPNMVGGAEMGGSRVQNLIWRVDVANVPGSGLRRGEKEVALGVETEILGRGVKKRKNPTAHAGSDKRPSGEYLRQGWVNGNELAPSGN